MKLMKIVILAGGPATAFDTLIKAYTGNTDTFIGVDRGAYQLMQAGFPVHLAIGDFDSLNLEEYKSVCAYADDVQQPCGKR
jgi:thiamine pyrophosphokinase